MVKRKGGDDTFGHLPSKGNVAVIYLDEFRANKKLKTDNSAGKQGLGTKNVGSVVTPRGDVQGHLGAHHDTKNHYQATDTDKEKKASAFLVKSQQSRNAKTSSDTQKSQRSAALDDWNHSNTTTPNQSTQLKGDGITLSVLPERRTSSFGVNSASSSNILPFRPATKSESQSSPMDYDCDMAKQITSLPADVGDGKAKSSSKFATDTAFVEVQEGLTSFSGVRQSDGTENYTVQDGSCSAEDVDANSAQQTASSNVKTNQKDGSSNGYSLNTGSADEKTAQQNNDASVAGCVPSAAGVDAKESHSYSIASHDGLGDARASTDVVFLSSDDARERAVQNEKHKESSILNASDAGVKSKDTRQNSKHEEVSGRGTIGAINDEDDSIDEFHVNPGSHSAGHGTNGNIGDEMRRNSGSSISNQDMSKLEKNKNSVPDHEQTNSMLTTLGSDVAGVAFDGSSCSNLSPPTAATIQDSDSSTKESKLFHNLTEQDGRSVLSGGASTSQNTGQIQITQEQNESSLTHAGQNGQNGWLSDGSSIGGMAPTNPEDMKLKNRVNPTDSTNSTQLLGHLKVSHQDRNSRNVTKAYALRSVSDVSGNRNL